MKDKGAKNSLLAAAEETEGLLKSHIKEYQRTTASGASTTVKEHDDNRKAADKASAAADKHQAGMDWNKPDTKKLMDLHHAAAKKHLAAMESAHKSGDKESMNYHYHKASLHLGASHSAGTFKKKDAEANAAAQKAMAKHVSEIADQHYGESKAHDLDHGSSIHLLAAEQHTRAKEAIMHAANQRKPDDEKDATDLADHKHHEEQRQFHGRVVKNLTNKTIDATARAYAASEKANKSGKAEDHRDAYLEHSNAAHLDYDDEGRAEHLRLAAEHDAKAK